MKQNRPLKILIEWLNDGFLLLPIRQFMTEGVLDTGEFSPVHSPMPDFKATVTRLIAERLIIADSQTIKYFGGLHPRESQLNRIYGIARNGLSFCWVDKYGHEAVPSLKYPISLWEEKDKLLRYEHERLIALPRGYTGEVCILAARHDHPVQWAYRDQRAKQRAEKKLQRKLERENK